MSRLMNDFGLQVANRELKTYNKRIQTNLERLGTGLAINRGEDDPDGLIASEALRAEKSLIGSTVINAERTQQVINVAEAGLASIQDQLLQLQGLVTRGTNYDGVSSREREAMQEEIDKLISSIDSTANTTSFQGNKLLNGDFNVYVSAADTNSSLLGDLNIDAVALGPNTTMQVDVEVLDDAKPAGVDVVHLLNQSHFVSSVTMEIAGPLGVAQFAFASGTTYSEAITSINQFKDLTGVEARFGASDERLTLRTTEVGSDQFVTARFVDGGESLTLGEAAEVEFEDMVVVFDISQSMRAGFPGTTVGDVDADGRNNRRSDAQAAALIALNTALAGAGRGNNLRIAMVEFGGGANIVDMNIALPGSQLSLTPNTDGDGNGLSDLEDVLRSGQHRPNSFGTNYEQSLREAINAFNALGTPTGKGLMVFLSDGFPFGGGPHADEADTLRSMGVDMRAFGIGPAAPLNELQVIDPNAQVVTTANDLTNALINAIVVPPAPVTRSLRQTGIDPTVRVNGQDAHVIANQGHLRASIRQTNLEVELTLRDPRLASTSSFTVVSGGARFGLEHRDVGHLRRGLQAVTSGRLGTLKDGRLASLRSGGTSNIIDGDFDRAQIIVRRSIEQIAQQRGLLGSYESNSVSTLIDSLAISAENTMDMDSQIRDTDFADVGAQVTRDQILKQSITSVIEIFKSERAQILELFTP